MGFNKERIKIAILGGGPSGLFMFKRLIESGKSDFSVTIIDRKQQLGAGMPYSTEGASLEHITNVSDNEVPNIVKSIADWAKTAPASLLKNYNIDPDNFNEYKVLPRLFFGEYLASQFNILLKKAEELGVETSLLLGVNITDVKYIDDKKIAVILDNEEIISFDKIIISTGHNWPKNYEEKFNGYFDSPYPPAKIAIKINHPVAIKGSSLTAIDAIRTLSRNNGSFSYDKISKKWNYKLAPGSENFKMVMHSRNGLLPAVRFHLEDSRLKNDSLLSIEELKLHKEKNNGFISLDFIFEKDFKEIFKTKNPKFYSWIKEMTIEDFVDSMMDLREKLEPFELLKAEYTEAEKSIRNKESIYWKEMLAILSFSMNYPAKYLAAEDMLRLQKILMPLISIVIAFVPQSSCEELMALHDAGVLEIISVGNDSEVKILGDHEFIYEYKDTDGNLLAIPYKTFVDAVGQPHLDYNKFIFKGLLNDKIVSSAKLKFQFSKVAENEIKEGNKEVKKGQDGIYYLNVPGITISDNFEVVDEKGNASDQIYIMAVPYIGGFNPDYSGIDFSEEASKRIVEKIFNN